MEYDPTMARELPQPSMPDLGAWVETWKRFASHMRKMVDDRLKAGVLDPDDADEFETVLAVSPPIDTAALTELSKSLPYDLPRPLRDFFLNGSAEITFRYAFDLGVDAPEGLRSWIHGGEMASVADPVFSAEKLSAYVTDAREYADNSGIADFPEDQEIWKRSIPFHRFNNADFLAFDPVDDPDDPYVIHLDHEGDPKLVSRNLASFLIEWPRICYVGPGDICDLEKFFDHETGVLSGDVAQAVALRAALQWTP